MAGPHSGANVHPRQISHNLVWNVSTLVWDAMTQPGGGASDATAANQAIEISHLSLLSTLHTLALDYDGSGNLIYYGRALVASSKASAVWQIRKFTYSGTTISDIQFAGGTLNFDQVWNNRAALIYS